MLSTDKQLGSIRNLRKTKINDRIGWIKPSKRSFKRKEKNEILKPRQVVRSKSLRRFRVNNRVACIPANRMAFYDFQQWSRPAGGGIDLNKVEPHTMFQMISEWSRDMLFQCLPASTDNMSFSQINKKIGHILCVPCNAKDRFYEFSEEFVTEYSDDKTKIDRLIAFFWYVLKAKGGIAKYMNECAFWRPDVMGAAQSINGVNKTWPDEVGGCPATICQFCGVCNMYSARDIINKPLRSKSKDPVPINTYDDTYSTEETTWEEVDGNYVNSIPVAWRCGFCFADLSIKPISVEFHNLIDKIEHLTNHYIGGLLDQLMKTRMTDFYDDADEKDRLILVEHDMAIAKRLLTKLYNGAIAVPTNIDSSQLSNYKKVMPQLTVIRSVLVNTVVPSLSVEIASLTGIMRSLFNNNTIAIYGSLVQLSDNNATTYPNYNSWLHPKKSTTSIKTVGKLNGPAVLEGKVEDLLAATMEHNGIYVIAPLKSGKYKECCTNLPYKNGSAYWTANNKSMPLELNAKTCDMLTHDVIRTGGGYHYVVDIEVGNFARLVFLTNQLQSKPDSAKYFDHDIGAEITLPLPCYADIIDGKLKIGVKCVKKRINAELLRALCIRNIQGKMEFNALAQYAIAFNMRRYTTGKVVLKQQHIDYSVIHFHVFACLYTMKLQNNMLPLAKAIYSTFNVENLMSVITGVVNEANKQFVLPDGIKPIVSMLDRSTELLANGSVPESFKYLHSYISTRITRNLRLYVQDEQNVNDTLIQCTHHTTKCKHRIVLDGCECCGAETNDKFCECCAPRDYSELIWGVTTQTAISALFTKISQLLSKLQTDKQNKIVTTKSKGNKIKPLNNKANVPNLSQAQLKLSGFLKDLDSKPTTEKEITLLATELTSNFNDESMEELNNYMHPMLLNMLTTENPAAHHAFGPNLTLPFVGGEYTIIQNAPIKIVERIELTNSEVNSCGYEAFQYLTQSELTLSDFKSLVGDIPFDESQIFYAAESIQCNLILYESQTGTLRAVKFDWNSDRFHTMMYDPPAVGTDIGHFCPVILEATQVLPYYKCDPQIPMDTRADLLNHKNNSMWLTEYTEESKDNMAQELTLLMIARTHTDNQIRAPEVLKIGTETFISNHKLNDLSNHKYNFKLTLCPELSDHITLTSLDIEHPMFKAHLTIPKEIPDDLTQLHRLMAIDEVHKMVKSVRNILSKDVHSNVLLTQTKVVFESKIQIHLRNIYVKPLDRVGLKNRDGSVMLGLVISTIDTTALIEVPEHKSIDNKYTLIVSKTSVASCLKKIYALEKAKRDGRHLANLLMNARCIMGYGGSGKSEEIIKNRTANTVVITSTTVAKENLIERGYPRHQAKTMERATWDWKDNFTHIYLDEANMLEFTDLSLIVTDMVESISMYYDETQISKFDSVSLQGIKQLSLVIQYPREKCRETWNYSRRFGGELTTGLRDLLPNIEDNDSKNTTLTFDNVQELNENMLLDIIRQHKPNVILNPYTAETSKLNEWLTNLREVHSNEPSDLMLLSQVMVAKNHSYQSREANNVVLIQWRINNSDMGLCRQKKYVVSAVTRAREHVAVVSVGFSRPVNRLLDAVSSVGGVIGTLRQCLDDDLQRTSEILNDALIYDMITSKPGPNELKLYRGNMYVGRYKKTDEGEWKGESSYPMVGKRLEDALNEPPGHSVKVKLRNPSNRILQNATRVKLLCWVNDVVVNSGKLRLGGDMRGITLKKGSGCPYMCSLTIFHNGTPIIYVSDAWSGMYRALSHDSKSAIAGHLVSYLEGNESGYWIDKVVYDSRLEAFMMIDRAFTIPFASLQMMAGQTKLSVDTTLSNATWLQSVLTKQRINNLPNWKSSVRHTIILYQTAMSNPLLGHSYRLMNHRVHQKFGTWSGSDTWIAAFNTILSTIKPVMRKDRQIAGSFGMYISPEEHIEKSTKVGVFLKAQKFKMELRTRDRVNNKVMVADKTKSFAEMTLQQEKLTNDYMTHNAVKITTDRCELVDSYMLSMFGNQGEGTKISYLGMNNQLIPATNRHYIKLKSPGIGPNLANWSATIDMAKQWFEAFSSRMEETLNVKVAAMKQKLSLMNDAQTAEAESLLKKLQQKSANSMIIETDDQPNDWLLIGTIAASMPIKRIIDLCILNNKLILSLPQVDDSATIADCGVEGNGTYLNSELINAAKLGFVKLGNHMLKFNNVETIAGFTIYEVNHIPTNEIMVNVASFTNSNPLVDMYVPSIEWKNIAEKSALITTKLVPVDKRLIDRCLNYCIANNPSSDGILAYVRSLLSTYDTSRTGIFPTYNINIEKAMNSAMAALTLYRYNYDGILSMSQFTQENSTLLGSLLKLNQTFNKDENLTDLLTGWVERSAKFLAFDIRKLTTAVKEIEVKMLVNEPKLLYVNTTKTDENQNQNLKPKPKKPKLEEKSNTTSSHESYDSDTSHNSHSESSSGSGSLKPPTDTMVTFKKENDTWIEFGIPDNDSINSSEIVNHKLNKENDEDSFYSAEESEDFREEHPGIYGNVTIDKKLATTTEKSKTSAKADASNPSNSFDRALVKHLSINKIMSLVDENFNSDNNTIWVLWEPIGKNKQTEFVERCIRHNQQSKAKFVVIEANNVELYVPSLLMEFKQHVTIQCWSDIVRMWLLSKYGGVWLDASLILDFTFNDPITYLENGNDGMLFYQKIVNNEYVLDNWMMAVKGNNQFIKTWYKVFMCIVYNGNDINAAIPMLNSLYDKAENCIDKNETYLTMHQASRIAMKVSQLPNYLLLPGFAGPLGWITNGMSMSEWMECIINGQYKPQGGAIKMIGLSRQIVCEWENSTGRDFVELVNQKMEKRDYLIIAVGTKGDILPARNLHKTLQALGLTGDILICSHVPTEEGELSVALEVDLLHISRINSLENIDTKLGFVSKLFKDLTLKLTGTSYKYLYANYSVPTMMQMARLVGAMPVNISFTPTFEPQITGEYFTMNGKCEGLFDGTTNSLTFKVARDNKLVWNSDSVVNSKSSLMQLIMTEPFMIKPDRMTTNKHVVGSIINGETFHTNDGNILSEQLVGRKKIDMLMPGPSINAELLANIVTTIQKNRFKCEDLVVVSLALKNLTKSGKSTLLNNLKRHYMRVKFVESVNTLRYSNKVMTMYCHGGVGTVCDALTIHANVKTFGADVDQEYWQTVKQVNNARTVSLDKLSRHMYNLNPLPAVVPIRTMFKNNGWLINPNSRRVESGEATVTFSPLDPDSCVEHCFNQWMKFNNVEWNTIAKSKLRRLMNMDQVIEMAFCLNINITIIQNGYATVWKWFETKHNICIELTTSTNLLHANLAKWTKASLISEELSIRSTSGMKEMVENQIIGNCNKDTIVMREFLKTGKWLEMVNKHSLKSKITMTANTRNLDSRMARVTNAVVLNEALLQEENIAQLQSDKLVHGKVYGCVSGNEVVYGLAIKSKEAATYIITSKPLSKVNVMTVDLGCQLIDIIKQDIRYSTNEDYHPLNVVTRSELQHNSAPVDVDMTLANADTKNVIVYHYDNRGHDKYNETNILSNCEKIHWMGQHLNEDDLQLLKESHGKQLRYVYYRGKLSYKVECKTQAEKFIPRALALDRNLEHVVDRGITILSKILTNDRIEIENWANKEIHEEFNKHQKVVRHTKSEWLTILGMSESRWEEWSSRCTRQNNDQYNAIVLISCDKQPNRGDYDALSMYNVVYTGRNMSYAVNTRCWLMQPRKGGAVAESFNEEKISLGNSKDWWRKLGNEPTILKELTPNPLIDTFTDTTETLNDSKWGSSIRMLSTFESDAVADEDIDFGLTMQGLGNDMQIEVTPHTIQNMWINTDLTMDLRQYAPVNSGTIRSRENPDKIRPSKKVTIGNATPMESRPVLTKWSFEEHRSVSGRLFSKLFLRKPEKTVSTRTRLERFVRCYFEPGFTPYIETNQILDVDAFETMLWISKRKDGLKIAQEVNDLLTDELGLMPLNAINIHLKLESLLKQSPIMHWGEHQARAIYWQRKAIAAISSPIFLKVKSRLKNSLKPKYVYADGLTPLELTYKTRQATNTNWFFENDLSKQDRQTDKPLIDVEMEIYALLGTSPAVLKWWRTMHETWKFKARWNKGYAKEMRLSGQSTTSLGNLITNMQVHNDLLLKNSHITNLVLFLGDDMLAMMSEPVNVNTLNRETKQMHNMQSTPYISEDCGLFCCMIAYKNGQGGVDLGPDYVRLKNRFEVTNGLSEANTENIQARCQSYACMLGNTKEMRNLKKNKGWTIPLPEWYTTEGLIPAIMTRYDLTEYEVMANYDKLCESIANPIVREVEFLTYTNVKVY